MLTRAAIGLLTAAVLACGGGRPSTPTAPDPGGQPAAPAPTPPSGATGCAGTSVGFAPLNDLGGETYQGQPGGLYPTGGNSRPGAHDAAGVALGRAIGPLDRDGVPDANGRYVFLSIGMSNTTQEFSTFKRLADADPFKNPALVVVDGAQGGVTANQWANPGCGCWSTVDQRLAGAGVTSTQVVAAWVKQANAAPTSAFPAHAQELKNHIIATVENLKTRYPNVQLAYLSSRIYGGYATTMLNPEPYAYESAFAVRWAIEDQMNGSPSLNFDPARGSVGAPWLAWGPYLWADGMRPRSDGLTWACSDFAPDGTHPSDAGRRKVANMLLAFMSSDATARGWYLR